jgi:glucose/arabinose dehydrogenase/cytochrome c2
MDRIFQALCSGQYIALLALLGFASQAATAANATRGKAVFKQSCLLCHTAEATDEGGAQGPSLIGLMGRRAASAPGFSYSQALRKSQLTFDAATLDRFLASPTSVVPGTSMPISTPSAEDRQDLIAYFSSLKGATPPAAQEPTGGASNTRPAEKSVLFGDWRTDAPGVKRHLKPSDLPKPYATPSARNSPDVVGRPKDAKLSVPSGFTVKPFSTELEGPRVIRIAPNGDIFVAETRAGRVSVLRAADAAEQPSQTKVFAKGFDQPFGIAFYPVGPNPQWVYIASRNSVVRIPYQAGDMEARGQPQTVVPKLADTGGGHSTRDLVFSKDGTRMFVSVGSDSNVAEREAKKSPEDIKRWEAQHGLGAAWGDETNRADVLVFDPEGKKGRVFASGIRNCVGLAVNPVTSDLWCVTNERDGLGDDLVPDYATRVREGAFYGWPWYYLGNHEDPRHKGERPDLAGKVTVPDVLFQAHSASVQITFYTATTGAAVFPQDYHGDAFVALHGSWNRSKRTGYKVVRVPLKEGVPSGEYEDFMTGFVVDEGNVWGRPVGVAVTRDGALLVSDDGGSVIWRVAYTAAR